MAGWPAVREVQHFAGALLESAFEMIIRYTYAMIYQVDPAVGRILDALKAAGLWEDTIVVFTSDHGDFLGDHRCPCTRDTSGPTRCCGRRSCFALPARTCRPASLSR